MSSTNDTPEGDPTSQNLAQPQRDEQEIFNELASLCSGPGYVHALAYLYQSNNFIVYGDKLTAEDLLPNYSHERLIRTELSTLYGLLMRRDIEFAYPGSHVIQSYIDRSNLLLSELHEALSRPMREEMLAAIKQGPAAAIPTTSGAVMREGIFYGAESAYVFQYIELARMKFHADDPWLVKNKGFSIQSACDVVTAILEIQPDRILSNARDIVNKKDLWTALPAFQFTVADIASITKLPLATVQAIVTAFSINVTDRNEVFQSLKDFNAVNATPLLLCPDGTFFSFHPASIAEALYESPFYWMLKDRSYSATAMKHRGEFTEQYCRVRLTKVFGESRVHSNIDLVDSQGQSAGEVDVLVLFGDRAIVLQAKSKRLTLEARKGNDLQLKEDFRLAVQDAYDQGAKCSELILSETHTLVDRITQRQISVGNLKEIYIFCVVADHYPSLSFQSREFIKLAANPQIIAPFVTDVFALDVLTEMLESPLRFLSYVNRRVLYHDRTMSSHETHLLAYHLRSNLWIGNDLDFLMIGDDVAVDLDIAMTVRRTGIPGDWTPKGILTRLQSTVIAQVLSEIEDKEEPAVIDFGFMLLTLGEDAILKADHHIQRINKWAARDGRLHDFTMNLSSASSGLTFHCSNAPLKEAQRALHRHCTRRKYVQRAKSWFGVCLKPGGLTIRTGVTLEYDWEHDGALDELTRDMSASSVGVSNPNSRPKAKPKTGRNEPCPCGSGKKFKKCCLGRR